MTVEIEPRRTYQQRDRRYVVEYVLLAFPGKPSFFNLRLGPPPAALSAMAPGINIDRLARVWKKTCDAVVVNTVEFVLIEGELRRPVESIGELLAYRDLIYTTPELRPFGRLPVRMLLVTPLADPSLKDTFWKFNIEISIYQPKWAMEYLREVM